MVENKNRLTEKNKLNVAKPISCGFQLKHLNNFNIISVEKKTVELNL